MSQIAKTILSPVTHLRNFVSAGAFAAANGILPGADPAIIKQAYQALQTGLKGTRQQNEFYEDLLRLGVTNRNVRLGDITKLMEDVGFGSSMTSDKGMRLLLRPLSKIKSTAQDLYTAEDDFWKMFSFIGETKRLKKYYEDAGLSGAQKFHTLAQSKRVKSLMDDGFSRKEAEKMVPQSRLTEELIEEEAASIVRNNIPNYAYVGNAVKGLRKLPVGNFVSFPAEIIRTGVNIVERALDEIFYTTRIKGITKRPSILVV
jgi:hypothetical protein